MILASTSKIRIVSLLLFLSVLLVIIWLKKDEIHAMEGFTQDAEFILMEDDDIFDEFYAEIHSTINEREKFVDSITNSIIKHASVDIENSSFLLISSDVGEQGNSLESKGITVDSIFKHKFMFEQTKDVYPDLSVKLSNFNNPMTYDKSSFTHILCIGNIIYTVKDKINFFRNMYNWLIPGGFLLIQLVERSRFNTIKTGNSIEIVDSPQKYHKERI